jgi:glycosyltransferase involved in cell wall biosynthesis/GT2 family glycosyltransferase
LTHQARRSLKRKLLLPVRFAWWTVTLQLPHRLKLRAQRKFLLESGLFDSSFYLQHNPDVAQAGMDPVEHYLAAPEASTRQPHPLFDPNWYLAQNPDIAAAGQNPLLHYLHGGWREHRNPGPLFDVAFYLAQNPDIAAANVEPLGQYLRSGAYEGRDPHRLFDSDFYLAQNAEVAAARANPLAHYVTGGWREHRNPHPFFDVAFYLKRYPDVAATGAEPLRHYLAAAADEKRDPHPLFDTHFYLQRNPEVQGSQVNPLVHFLRNPARDPNRYFDVAWYLEQNPELPETNQAAVQHYLQTGTKQDRNPHPCFDTNWYLARNPEVARSGENPLAHFLLYGRYARRDPHPLFDSQFYSAQRHDLAEPGIALADHYFHSGGFERLDPHPLFDSDWYLAVTPDAANAKENPLTHYLRRGWKEKRSPCAYFDGAFYLEQNPEVAKGTISALEHYLLAGAAEGLDPSRWFDTDWYVAQNPEVRAAGWNPLVHYVRVGLKESKPARLSSTSQDPQPSKPLRKNRRRIVFISGEPETPGHQYRVVHLATALAPQFFETVIVSSAEIPQRFGEIETADLVWIWRTRLSAETAGLIAAARDAGGAILYDIDDLMFRPELAVAELIDGIRTQNISEADVQKFYTAIRLLLVEADRCTAPTVPLAREIRKLHKPATVIPNGFDTRTRERARSALRARRSQPDDGLVRIGYASGTLTHQRDFAVAAPALAVVLQGQPSARLVLFRGATDIAEFPAFENLHDRIEWRDRVPVEELPREYARFDVNIAPLQAGNRYCEAKSELKFFEAALAGVPTIASPTQPFRDAIRDAETGLLAANDDDWQRCLTKLIADPELRRRMADAAYRDVLWLYGPERRRLLATQLLNESLAPVPLRFDLFRLEMQIENAHTLPPIALPQTDVLFQSARKGDSRVSVIMPLFNYGQLVEEALESVRQQTVRDIDLVVVDDRSTDNSVTVAKRWLEKHASEFNMVALLQNRQNSKLGSTRNAAANFADTELYMALDPDNALYPDCLEKCMAALDETGAAFAYPTVDLFGERTGQIGLLEYDPALFPCANYIDAMAMVRKACWIAVGGYSALDPMGWEDYEFWCKMAEKGLFGVRVHQTAARYRTHGVSMLRTITDLPENKRRVLEDLNARHPWLQLPISASEEDAATEAASAASGQFRD